MPASMGTPARCISPIRRNLRCTRDFHAVTSPLFSILAVDRFASAHGPPDACTSGTGSWRRGLVDDHWTVQDQRRHVPGAIARESRKEGGSVLLTSFDDPRLTGGRGLSFAAYPMCKDAPGFRRSSVHARRFRGLCGRAADALVPGQAQILRHLAKITCSTPGHATRCCTRSNSARAR